MDSKCQGPLLFSSLLGCRLCLPAQQFPAWTMASLCIVTDTVARARRGPFVASLLISPHAALVPLARFPHGPQLLPWPYT